MRSYSPVSTHAGVLWASRAVLAVYADTAARVGQNSTLGRQQQQFTGAMFRQRPG